MSWEPITIGEALRRTALRYPEREALVGEGQRITFAELDRRVNELAAGLMDIGVAHGDNVAVWMTNTPCWVEVWFACARIGAVAVPVNTRFKTAEARYVLEQSEARVLVMMDRYWDIDFLGMAREMIPGMDAMTPGALRSETLPALHSVVLWNDDPQPGTFSIGELRRRDGSGETLAQRGELVSPDDTVIIVYTSGTTGHPKGAMHSHVVLRNAANIARVMRFESGARVLGHMPFYHVAGSVTTVLPCVLMGCTLVTMPQWNAEKALELISGERVNFFGGIPTHFIDCLSVLRERHYDTSCLRSAWIGGAPVTPDVARAAFDELRLDALQAVYGMTETTGATVFSEFDAPMEILCDNKGKPIGEFEVEIAEPGGERRLGVNEVGEVLVRGHIVMQGYYKNPQATRDVLTGDGFFRTGDLGYFDEDGYLKVTGRVKEMFIVGGSNAYPAEIERIIQAHEAVRQAIVVGVPDNRLGEVGFAFVELEEDGELSADALIRYCRENMADYKVPRHIRFADEFPRTPTGKIQRFVLAREARDLAAAGERDRPPADTAGQRGVSR